MSGFLEGKKGLILGVANDKSIAWGIAELAAQQGAELAFTYQGDVLEKRVRPLAEKVGASLVLECDVSKDDHMDRLFAELEEKWGKIDFILHAVAFADKSELTGDFANTSRANFLQAMDISCYSLVALTKRAIPLMNEGGSILTLSYHGAQKYIPNYNVMGVAKAALEASVRYLAVDMGKRNVRVNAISAGPIRTLAASGIGDFKSMLKWNEKAAPLKRNITLEDVSGSGLYFLSSLSSGVTGEVHYVDCGANIMGLAPVSEE